MSEDTPVFHDVCPTYFLPQGLKRLYGCISNFFLSWSLISFQSAHLIARVYFPSPHDFRSAAILQKLDVKHPFHVLPREFS